MDFDRAQVIISSPKEFEVSYNGVSIWIDKLHEDGKTATVHLRHAHEDRSEVDVSELKEEYLVQ